MVVLRSLLYSLYAGPSHAARRLQAALLASARPQPLKKERPSRTGKARPAGRRTVPAPLSEGINHGAHGAQGARGTVALLKLFNAATQMSISQTVAGASLNWTGARS